MIVRAFSCHARALLHGCLHGCFEGRAQGGSAQDELQTKLVKLHKVAVVVNATLKDSCVKAQKLKEERNKHLEVTDNLLSFAHKLEFVIAKSVPMEDLAKSKNE